MNDLIIIQNIQDKIYEIRGQRVMLDRDIAAFYGVEPKRLNEKVKRNPKRFAGEDFMFQLTSEELADLRAQVGRHRPCKRAVTPHARRGLAAWADGRGGTAGTRLGLP